MHLMLIIAMDNHSQHSYYFGILIITFPTSLVDQAHCVSIVVLFVEKYQSVNQRDHESYLDHHSYKHPMQVGKVGRKALHWHQS